MALCPHQKQRRWPQEADTGLYKSSQHIAHFQELASSDEFMAAFLSRYVGRRGW